MPSTKAWMMFFLLFSMRDSQWNESVSDIHRMDLRTTHRKCVEMFKKGGKKRQKVEHWYLLNLNVIIIHICYFQMTNSFSFCRSSLNLNLFFSGSVFINFLSSRHNSRSVSHSPISKIENAFLLIMVFSSLFTITETRYVLYLIFHSLFQIFTFIKVSSVCWMCVYVCLCVCVYLFVHCIVIFFFAIKFNFDSKFGFLF